MVAGAIVVGAAVSVLALLYNVKLELNNFAKLVLPSSHVRRWLARPTVLRQQPLDAAVADQDAGAERPLVG
jgi:hypothetical protein